MGQNDYTEMFSHCDDITSRETWAMYDRLKRDIEKIYRSDFLSSYEYQRKIIEIAESLGI